MNYIDLTHIITDNMPSHPQDIAIQLKVTALYKEHGVANHALCGSVHMGTHIDAPGHFTELDKKITDFPISTFIGKAVCIDAFNCKIINKDLLLHTIINKDTIVLFYTGWDVRFYEHDYFYEHPVINEDCAQYLVDLGVKMVGVDMPSVDNDPYAVHKIFLRNNILIIENLTNLGTLVNKHLNLIALPLKIDAHGAPARVIALI